MIDIIFIVLVFFIFLIGFSNYEHFQSNATPEDDLYQTNGLKALTSILDENIPKIYDTIKSMVSGLKGELEGKLNGIKNHIEDCVSYVQHCGKEPYPSTCSKEVCAFGKCKDVDYGCTKWRSKCTQKYPLWTCSPKPSGYPSPPGFPSGWRR